MSESDQLQLKKYMAIIIKVTRGGSLVKVFDLIAT